MGSYERKLKRRKVVKQKKQAEKDMATKVALFGELGTECLTCKKPFDRMDREQVMSWHVVVRKEEEKVNLYCPHCWQNAMKIIKDYTNKRRNENAILSTKQ